MLILNIKNQLLSLEPLQEEEKIIANSRNYLKMIVNFPSEWQDTLNYALFTHRGKTYKKYLGIEDGVNENECFVAPEVIKAGVFTVSVFCDDYITTNIVEIPVKPSGYTDKIENQPATAAAID